MAVLTRPQLYQLGYNAGFRGSALDEVVAIALAESGGDPLHTHVNPASSGWGGKNVPAGTVDRGILQINNWWNPGVSDATAFNPQASFQWAYQVTQGGQPGLFNAYWSTVKNGAYRQYLTPGGYQNVQGSQPVQTQQPQATTGTGAGPAQVSSQNLGWVNTPVTQAYNPPTEYGVDLGTPYGTPIGSLVNGTVVQEGYYPWGGAVDIQTVLNGQTVDWYVQHLDTIASNIVNGASVTVGELLGTSGGQTSGGNHPTSPQYSTGPHTETGFNAPWLTDSGANFNPTSFVQSFRTGGGPTNTAQPANNSNGNLWQTIANNLFPYAPSGTVYNSVNAAGQSVQQAVQPSNLFGAFTGINLSPALGTSDFWIRAGLVVFGLILVLLALSALLRKPLIEGAGVVAKAAA